MPLQTAATIREQYEQDGFFLSPEPILPAAVVEGAVRGMDAVRAGQYDTGMPPQPSPWNPGDDARELCKIEMPQQASRAIMELVSHAELGRWAAAVTGAERIQVWWVQLLYKPPAVQGAHKINVGWHQDRHYWGAWEEGSELFTAWVALGPVGEQSGPMRFVRGSHRWGRVQGGDFFGQDLERLQTQIERPGSEKWEEVPALLGAGGVSFHHCLTLHGSGPNRSAQARRSFAIHLCTQNARPVDDRRAGLTAFIDDYSRCPIIYGEKP